jgi:hypothetical protein
MLNLQDRCRSYFLGLVLVWIYEKCDGQPPANSDRHKQSWFTLLAKSRWLPDLASRTFDIAIHSLAARPQLRPCAHRPTTKYPSEILAERTFRAQ